MPDLSHLLGSDLLPGTAGGAGGGIDLQGFRGADGSVESPRLGPELVFPEPGAANGGAHVSPRDGGFP